MTTGVFFHKMFSGEEWIIIGDKFHNFPQVMEHVLEQPEVKLFTPQKATEELLLKIHTPRFVEDLKRAWYYEGAIYSVGGCVEATERILAGELENALEPDVLIVAVVIGDLVGEQPNLVVKILNELGDVRQIRASLLEPGVEPSGDRRVLSGADSGQEVGDILEAVEIELRGLDQHLECDHMVSHGKCHSFTRCDGAESSV